MLFNSLEYLVFLPVVVTVYFSIPKRIRKIWLLIASYFFYMCWNSKYALLILSSTIITFFTAKMLDRIELSYHASKRTRYKKYIMAGSIGINMLILFYFKYISMMFAIIGGIAEKIGVAFRPSRIDVLLPVGISFYTFQAIGYIIDVYRGDTPAEKDFVKYALFVSFFPQLVAGPIERSRRLLNQLSCDADMEPIKIIDGLLMILWGLFLKIVIADRIAIFVDTIFNNSYEYEGCYFVVAIALFSIQIYCDFAGYSIIAKGSAQMLNIDLIENFDSPYLATSVTEFWRRWHISLTSWFKDYLYIPLGGSRKGKIRKYINKMIVFLLSGLWHGADLSYVVWGGINGFYQIVGEQFEAKMKRLEKRIGIEEKSIFSKCFKMIITYALISFSWIFFRANSCRHAMHIIKSIVLIRNPWILCDESLYSCGLDRKNFWLMLISIFVLLCVDIEKRKGVSIREIVLEESLIVRACFTAFAIVVIAIFGIWGPAYNAANFIYFQF